jgi:hypothetical protein
VDHVTIYRWVQTFTEEFIDAVRTARHVKASSTRTTRSRLTTADSRPDSDRRGGMKAISSMRGVAAGHAFVQHLRRGPYEIADDRAARERVRTGFDELALCI